MTLFIATNHPTITTLPTYPYPLPPTRLPPMGWNYLSIPKLQFCNHWSLEMDKKIPCHTFLGVWLLLCLNGVKVFNQHLVIPIFKHTENMFLSTNMFSMCLKFGVAEYCLRKWHRLCIKQNKTDALLGWFHTVGEQRNLIDNGRNVQIWKKGITVSIISSYLDIENRCTSIYIFDKHIDIPLPLHWIWSSLWEIERGH